MAVLDTLRTLLTPVPAMQTRALGEPIIMGRPFDTPTSWGDVVAPFDRPPLAQQVAALQQPATLPTVSQAISIPTVFRALNLIAGLISNLRPQVWRLVEGGEPQLLPTPPVIARPNPFISGRRFYYETAWSAAAYGEFVHYIAARDPDGRAASLLNVPPYEIKVSETRRPYGRKFEWHGAEMPASRMVHIPVMGRVGEIRGRGPLQECRVALAVAAEAEIYAEKYFGGAPPLVVLQYAGELSEDEAEALLTQWNERAGQPTRVLDQSATANKLDADPASAQLIESRQYSAVSVSQMFGIPAPLLEAAVGGSQLTYRTIPDAMRQLLDLCVEPLYLGPIEDALSDLLPRGQVVRFDRSALLRATAETQPAIAALPANPYPVNYPEV